jgi:hypothetical protein
MSDEEKEPCKIVGHSIPARPLLFQQDHVNSEFCWCRPKVDRLEDGSCWLDHRNKRTWNPIKYLFHYFGVWRACMALKKDEKEPK